MITTFLACFFGSWIGTTLGLLGSIIYAAYKVQKGDN